MARKKRTIPDHITPNDYGMIYRRGYSAGVKKSKDEITQLKGENKILQQDLKVLRKKLDKEGQSTEPGYNRLINRIERLTSVIEELSCKMDGGKTNGSARRLSPETNPATGRPAA